MEINIIQLGAKGDGKTFNTEIIQRAIDECHEKGGGKVIIPQGTYLCKPLKLKSNVTIYLEEGAVLKATTNINDYYHIGYHHNEWKEVTSFLYAMNEKNISIEGKGTIDLSGKHFMDFTRTHNEFEELKFLDKEQFEETECKTKPRPNQPIFFYNCENLYINGISITDSPCWTICVHSSTDIKIDSIRIFNHLRVPNSDGVHLCSCNRAFIKNSTFICGDDCIAITGITNWEKTSENIVICDCILESRSSGIRIGHLDSKVRNVIISNLIISNSNRGVGIFADGNNGYVESVFISNLIVRTKIFAGTWWGKGEPLVILAPKSGNKIRDISIRDIRAYAENGILIYGERNNIEDILLKDIDIRLNFGKNRILFGKELDLSPNPKVAYPDYEKKIPWIIAKDVLSLNIQNVTYSLNREYDKELDINGIFERIEKLSLININKII
jgi:polygalacturonase